MPWAGRHLPLEAGSRGRTLAGYSAGAYGSVDMGLRHPGCSARLNRGAGTSGRPGTGRWQTRAHPSGQPTTRKRSWRPTRPSCGRGRVRFFVSAGRRERKVLLASRDFARELAGVRLEHVLDVTAGGHHGGTWRAVLPVGLRYAFAR